MWEYRSETFGSVPGLGGLAKILLPGPSEWLPYSV